MSHKRSISGRSGMSRRMLQGEKAAGSEHRLGRAAASIDQLTESLRSEIGQLDLLTQIMHQRHQRSHAGQSPDKESSAARSSHAMEMDSSSPREAALSPTKAKELETLQDEIQHTVRELESHYSSRQSSRVAHKQRRQESSVMPAVGATRTSPVPDPQPQALPAQSDAIGNDTSRPAAPTIRRASFTWKPLSAHSMAEQLKEKTRPVPQRSRPPPLEPPRLTSLLSKASRLQRQARQFPDEPVREEGKKEAVGSENSNRHFVGERAAHPLAKAEDEASHPPHSTLSHSTHRPRHSSPLRPRTDEPGEDAPHEAPSPKEDIGLAYSQQQEVIRDLMSQESEALHAQNRERMANGGFSAPREDGGFEKHVPPHRRHHKAARFQGESTRKSPSAPLPRSQPRGGQMTLLPIHSFVQPNKGAMTTSGTSGDDWMRGMDVKPVVEEGNEPEEADDGSVAEMRAPSGSATLEESPRGRGRRNSGSGATLRVAPHRRRRTSEQLEGDRPLPAAASAQDGPVLQGQLWKADKRGGSWKRRWVVLYPRELYYYLSPSQFEEACASGKLDVYKPAVDMSAVVVVIPTKPGKHEWPEGSFPFNLQRGGRTFWFAAFSEQERDTWVTHLCAVTGEDPSDVLGVDFM